MNEVGGNYMKNDQAINLRVDELMFRTIGKLAAEIDCTQAEVIRNCLRLSLPQVKAHPFLIKLLPSVADNARNDV